MTLRQNKTTISVILLLITALVGKSVQQNQLQAITDLSYHHVHHSVDYSDIDDEPSQEEVVDRTSLPHHHDERTNAAEHGHCHSHGSQIIDTPLLGSDMFYAYQSAFIQNIEKCFKYDGIIRGALSATVFRPPIA